MKRLELTKFLEIDPKELAIESDAHSVSQLRATVEILTTLLITAETAQKVVGDSTNGRFLIIGSAAFDKLEIGTKGCIVHCIDEVRRRRKG